MQKLFKLFSQECKNELAAGVICALLSGHITKCPFPAQNNKYIQKAVFIFCYF